MPIWAQVCVCPPRRTAIWEDLAHYKASTLTSKIHLISLVACMNVIDFGKVDTDYLYKSHNIIYENQSNTIKYFVFKILSELSMVKWTQEEYFCSAQ